LQKSEERNIEKASTASLAAAQSEARFAETTSRSLEAL
jgi:hypothetical protein